MFCLVLKSSASLFVNKGSMLWEGETWSSQGFNKAASAFGVVLYFLEKLSWQGLTIVSNGVSRGGVGATWRVLLGDVYTQQHMFFPMATTVLLIFQLIHSKQQTAYLALSLLEEIDLLALYTQIIGRNNGEGECKFYLQLCMLCENCITPIHWFLLISSPRDTN